MALKIGNRLVGQTAQEQQKLERKRFLKRQALHAQKLLVHKQELIEIGKGSRKLSEFF